ncbi:tether containing UBX domain for [Musa troglodytarum]|uniref:Tether containing UBX domain for n=1 Tax=Musa troglodytarum TaxID=320322 RepID=A0A9E7HVH2_9LILI|nr:tether containing UBX domain for [Musa troglodytarum]
MASKRARLSTSVEAESAPAKLEVVAAELGHEIRVFLATSQTKHAALTTSNEDDADDFYDLTAEDYYNLISSRAESQILKTQKMREAEAVACRERLNKAVIRVRFPDDYILEAKFQPTETIQTLVDLLMKVVAQPNLPFYLFTTPPKQRIADLSKDFYTAGFAPGANVYFSYDVPGLLLGVIISSQNHSSGCC